jgi:hypothetical protein
MGGALLGAHGSALLLALALLWWREHRNSSFGRRRPLAPAAASS